MAPAAVSQQAVAAARPTTDGDPTGEVELRRDRGRRIHDILNPLSPCTA